MANHLLARLQPKFRLGLSAAVIIVGTALLLGAHLATLVVVTPNLVATVCQVSACLLISVSLMLNLGAVISQAVQQKWGRVAQAIIEIVVALPVLRTVVFA